LKKKRNRPLSQVSFRSFGGDWPPPHSSAVFTGQTQNFLPSPRVLDFVVRQKLLLLSGRVVTWYGPRSTCSAGLGLGQQIFFLHCIALCKVHDANASKRAEHLAAPHLGLRARHPIHGRAPKPTPPPTPRPSCGSRCYTSPCDAASRGAGRSAS
jgi:hypothetical protein